MPERKVTLSKCPKKRDSPKSFQSVTYGGRVRFGGFKQAHDLFNLSPCVPTARAWTHASIWGLSKASYMLLPVGCAVLERHEKYSTSHPLSD